MTDNTTAELLADILEQKPPKLKNKPSNIISTAVIKYDHGDIEVTITAEMLALDIASEVAEFYKGNNIPRYRHKNELLEKIDTLIKNIDENCYISYPKNPEYPEVRETERKLRQNLSNKWHDQSKNMLHTLEDIQKGE